MTEQSPIKAVFKNDVNSATQAIAVSANYQSTLTLGK